MTSSKTTNNTKMNHLSSYEVKANTTDLTTVMINSENKGYLVDQKFIDILLDQLIPVDFESFKADLLFTLTQAENLEDLTTRFNNGVYIQTILEKLYPTVNVPVASSEGLDEWYDGNDGPKVIGKINLDSNMMA